MESVEPSIKTLEEKYGLFIQSVAIRFDPACIYYQYTPKLQEAQNLVVDKNWLTDTAPIAFNVTEGTERYNKILAEIKPEYETMVSKYILSPSDPSQIWSDWLAKAQSLGVDELTSLYNETYKKIKEGR